MNFEECIKKGLIRRDSTAGRFLKSAKRTMEIEEYNVAEIAAYLAAFHATRALLYAKGYKERSHVCLGIAVRELYDDEAIREHMITFDRIREMRHEIQYLGREPSKEECEFAFSFASELIDLVKKALNISETYGKDKADIGGC